MAAKKKTAKKKAGKKKTAKKTGGKKVIRSPSPKQVAQVIDKYRVKLESNVPVPSTARYTRGKYDDILPPMKEMEIGDTFFIPDGLEGIENASSVATSQCARWNRYFDGVNNPKEGKRRYIQRGVTELIEGVPVYGARIWRIE